MKAIIFLLSLFLFSCNIQITELTESKTEHDLSDFTVYWSAPIQRENGDVMSISELGGYILRHRDSETAGWTEIELPASVTQYSLSDVSNDHIVEVAAFDVDLIYSRFVAAQ